VAREHAGRQRWSGYYTAYPEDIGCGFFNGGDHLALGMMV
jgi:hypothetical protein